MRTTMLGWISCETHLSRSKRRKRRARGSDIVDRKVPSRCCSPSRSQLFPSAEEYAVFTVSCLSEDSKRSLS
ncbi:hypothetical protein HPP92_016741 [Vanilla planifolia]|uniref:Uncharacterized protein n=1 Tax=Vanilla planifolia TaxID=51239 RepID=A0A835QFS3_VANPL|nr:hypothetical protein HPP92_016741 [Vanilla planifolia]